MDENRSLEEFAAGEPADGDAEGADDDGASAPDPEAGAEGESEADGAADDGSAGSGDEPAADAVEPLTGVYDWRPDGGACAACGATVETRWRDDGELVCAECKVW